MSKLMLTRASTVVLKNRRRYSVRTRNARPRRQSAPTVLQRTPASPRGHPTPSPSPVPPGRQGAGAGGGTFTYPHLQKDSGAEATLHDNYLRRGSVQPHLLHQCASSPAAAATTGGAAVVVASTGVPRALPATATTAAAANSSCHPNFHHHHQHHRKQQQHAAAPSITDIVASANAELARVQVDSPKLKRITFQDCVVSSRQAEAPDSLPCFQLQVERDTYRPRHLCTRGLEPSCTLVSPNLEGHIAVGCDLYPIDPRCKIFRPTPPPSEKALYESTVVWTDADDQDQTFTILGSLCEAGVETSNPCDFIFRAFFILSGTWPVTVFLVGLLALPLVMTTIGVNYLHDCPVEPKLPIYLVVGGCFGIVKLLFLLWKQIKRHKEDMGDLHDDEDLLTMTRMTNIALNIFLCVWFAFGHYWVFHIWKPHFTAPLHEPRNWCDETVFTFSFWQLVICHAVLGLVLAISFIMCCCFVCVKCLIADAKR